MKPPSTDSDPIAQAAAAWVLKHDRGLTAAEQDEFSQWLATNAAHRQAYAEARRGWDDLDRIAGLQTSLHALPDPDLLAPQRWWTRPAVRRVGWPVLALAAAGAVVLAAFTFKPAAPAPVAGPIPTLALIEQRTLADGSTVQLNRGSVLAENYTAAERRVKLEQGEAHFTVVKDAARPFIVEAAGVAVRAVGTAFNVRLESTAVEVLVTEGRVEVNDASRGQSLLGPERDGAPPLLTAGQSARVDLAPTTVPRVATVSAAQIEEKLAWQPRLLDFTNAPMPEIVAAFNRGNPVRLNLGDTALRDMRLSATFRSDNVEGFVRLMESDFGLQAEWHGGEIVLRRAR
jgi:transmembrane sensor